jgi:hypothetical protein
VSSFQTILCQGFGYRHNGGVENEVAMTLVLLEQEFPHSFFDVMTHLLVHLVEELELCGLVHTW